MPINNVIALGTNRNNLTLHEMGRGFGLSSRTPATRSTLTCKGIYLTNGASYSSAKAEGVAVSVGGGKLSQPRQIIAGNTYLISSRALRQAGTDQKNEKSSKKHIS